MRFRIFGIPTEVQAGFWLIAVLLALDTLLYGQHKYLVLVWIAVVFVSILIHELGHAVVMIRYGLSPDITLHMLGGATAAHGMNRLSRLQRIFVSFAGPLAGFVFGGLVIAVTRFFPQLEAGPGTEPTMASVVISYAILNLKWVNIGWGVINLIPVLPLDGGHILEDALGPRRFRLTATISLIAGGAVVLGCVLIREFWIAFIFGLSTWQTYQRFRAMSAPATVQNRRPPEPAEPAVPTEIAARLQEAERALAEDRYDEAGTLAELVLSDNPPPRARNKALHVIGWAHLLEDRPDEAARVLMAIRRDGKADPALAGSVLLAKGELDQARKVLQDARGEGDDRKEIIGPLIQILIRQGEVARAAALAFDIVDTLSDDDARQMAHIAFEHESYTWSSRLSEAVFERSGSPDDAYDAARSRALEGDPSAALQLLRRAVAAGFTDAARAWSDKALEALRSSEEKSELEALLPRPAK